MMTAAEFWEFMHAWLDEHAPEMRSLIQPPASEEQVATLESAIGQSLPREFKASYLIHNGCTNAGLVAGLPMMSIEQCLSHWEMWSEIAEDDYEELDEACQSVPSDAVQLKYAHQGWLPFCGDSQNFVALDFAPSSAGTNGQVINTGRDDEIRHVIAPDIDGFFAFVVEQFRGGRVTVVQSQGSEASPWLALNESADLLTALPDVLKA